MDSGNNNVSPERLQTPASSQPNFAPGVGNVAANLAPNNPDTAQNVAGLFPAMPEVGPLGGAERLSNPELQTGPGSSASQQQTSDSAAVQQVVVPQIQNATSAGTATISGSTPVSAADDDLIEKEWVDKAKKVVAGSRDNPHEQARLVAELMRDYVRKRYGKEVGKAPDDV